MGLPGPAESTWVKRREGWQVCRKRINTKCEKSGCLKGLQRIQFVLEVSGDWEREGRSQIKDFYIQANCLCLLCASRWLLANVGKSPQTSILTLGSLPAVSCLLSIRRPLRSLPPSRYPSGDPHSSHTIWNPIRIEEQAARYRGWREREGVGIPTPLRESWWTLGTPTSCHFFLSTVSGRWKPRGPPWTPVLRGWPYCEQDGHAMEGITTQCLHHWGWTTSERYRELSGAEGCSPLHDGPRLKKGLQK